MPNLSDDILNLNIIIKKLKAWKTDYYKDYDLTDGQVSILMALYKNGDMTQSDLADYLSVHKNSISLDVKKLARIDYLTKSTNEVDKRSNYISLTEKAKKLMPKIDKNGENYAEMLMTGMSEEEKEQWSKLLKIAANNSISMNSNLSDYNHKWVYISADRLTDKDAEEFARLLKKAGVIKGE